jgi:hypothetical protein
VMEAPFTLSACNVYSAEVDLSPLSDGMYMLEVLGPEDQLVTKVIKQ